MELRDFLKAGSLASSGFLMQGTISRALGQTLHAPRWRVFEVTTRVEVLKPTGTTRV